MAAAGSRARQLVRFTQAVRQSTFSCCAQRIRLLHHVAGPSQQASLVDTRPARIKNDDTFSHPPASSSSSSSSSSLDVAKPSSKVENPIQKLYDAQSGITITTYPSTVSIQSPKHGLVDEYQFPHVWLRDVCTEESSIEKNTKQKLFHTSDIYIPSSNSTLGLLNDDNSAKLVQSNSSSLPILQLAFSANHPVVNAFSAAFSSAPPSSKDAHISNIPISTLLEHALPKLYATSHGDIGGVAQPWTSSQLSSFPSSTAPLKAVQVKPTASFDREAAFARPARLQWSSLLGKQESALDAKFALVNGLMRDGIAFVTELPTDKTGNSVEASQEDSPQLARLAEMLGEIRHTFYGSLWNVRSLGSSSKNIAYTNLDLGLHMDLCYFQNPPRFQFLHMLQNKVKGGESIFVDSFKVAEEMWENHRPLWQVLTEVPVGFHYQNDGRHYRYTHPTFEMTSNTSGHADANVLSSHYNSSKMPRLTAVNYSPPFQSPLPLYPAISTEKQSSFYEALQLFSNLTLQEKFRYERTLVEGEAVIFDNRRVLHSRRGFEWSKEEESREEVKRWLKGCYVDGDAIWSTYRTLAARSKGGKLGL